MAKRDAVELRYYSIIYNVIDDVKAALTGMLAPTLREKFLGNAQILQVFNITKVGKIAGLQSLRRHRQARRQGSFAARQRCYP